MSAGTTGGNPSAAVSFAAPASDGGSPITGYSVIVQDHTASTTATIPVPVSAATSGYTVTGLQATDDYSFSVFATNVVGNGTASTPVRAYPASPSGVTAVSHGDGTATISWVLPTVTLGNPVTGFGVEHTGLHDVLGRT